MWPANISNPVPSRKASHSLMGPWSLNQLHYLGPQKTSSNWGFSVTWHICWDRIILIPRWGLLFRSAEIREHLAQVIHSRNLADPKNSIPPTVSHRKPTLTAPAYTYLPGLNTYVHAACLSLGMCHFLPDPVATFSLESCHHMFASRRPSLHSLSPSIPLTQHWALTPQKPHRPYKRGDMTWQSWNQARKYTMGK